MPRPQRQSSRAPLSVVPIPTPDGLFIAHFSERGLARLDFPNGKTAPPHPKASTKIPPHLGEWTSLTRETVRAILLGEKSGSLPPLDITSGTAFQRRVWSALRQIAAGTTRSYAEVAAAVGSRKATRAVGRACGANPIPLLIPCHRVLASGGKLGGFSGGMSWKLKLLAAEGTLPKALKRADGAQQRSFSFATEPA